MAVKRLQSLEHAIRVLEEVAAEQPVGVGTLARRLGIDKSAVQRILVTLHAADWIRPDGSTPTRWELTARPLGIVSRAARPADLRERARPVLEDLRTATGETVLLAARNADRIVAVEVLESPQPLRMTAEVGMVLPVLTGAAGRALLAALGSDDEVRSLLGTDPPIELVHELDRTRRRGYATSPGLVDPGASTVAAAIRDAAGHPVGALVIAAPTVRMPQRRMHEYGRLLADAVASLREQPGAVVTRRS